MQLHQPEFLRQLAAAEGQILVLSFAVLAKLQLWVPHFQINFLDVSYREQGLTQPPDLLTHTRFMADPTLKVYHAYGLGQNKASEVYSRKVLLQYARWARQGKPVKKPEQDPLQRGGDFVVNRAGLITLSHTGHNQAERPTPTQILQALT